MTDRKKYSQKYKDDAVELVISSGRPIAQVAPEIGVNEGTLGTWVRRQRVTFIVAHKDRQDADGLRRGRRADLHRLAENRSIAP